ncbi:phytoene/squalene synthase family protein [Thermochromatium tepidum]|uniref:Phytoene/squalene synthase family protein n=1 Tax=Thermochromatium tepidum ATCC 43061 TaxID=316276 RepID=A0A6I6E573_THETI|nr:phytoene/squalene synthase family protein [Thermochromatium tepidum]QGU31813.1 phytoene/squalene synthase family protein [Thermochromatium tepidum ATCC 43061]
MLQRSSDHNHTKKQATAADIAVCRELLRGGSRSFYAASFLLPARFRDPAIVLYAFCRIADDAIDCVGDDPVLQAQALERLHDRLDRLYAGHPNDDPIDRALAEVVRKFAIPKRLFEALFEGFAWDAEGRRYEDLSGVYAYSARVAGTVGAMMAALMGARSEDLVARACDLGVAMQITNICRDVGEDARNGRIYLPLSWVREAGVDPDEWLKNPVFNEAIASVVRRLLQTADELYRRSDAGIAGLPLGCRAGINAARYLYAEIGRQVERQGLDSISRRAVVPVPRKLQLLAPILGRAVVSARPIDTPALEETRFLVDAVVAETPRRTPVGVGERVIWVLELFQQLEERERAALSLR